MLGGWLKGEQSYLIPCFRFQELEELDAIAECKAQMHLMPTPPDPRICGLTEGPQAWLSRRQSRALLSALQQSSSTWVPAAPIGSRRPERRLRQRIVQARRRLEALQALLTDTTRLEEPGTSWDVLGQNAQKPLKCFLEREVLQLGQLANMLQRDLDCQLQQLKGAPPCPSQRCAAVAHALWLGRLPKPWRSHAPAGPQPPWHWLRQLSRRGQLLVRYRGRGAEVSERVFHLSAFCHPRRLLLALFWEASLNRCAPRWSCPDSQGIDSSQHPNKCQEIYSNALRLRVF